MQLKTILNRVQKFKRFTFGKVTWRENTSEPALQVSVHPRRNSGQSVRCTGEIVPIF